MKFLHTSDWHLGMTFRGGVSYGRDQRYVIDNICRIAVNEKVDGILLAGDVFDKSIASQEAIRIYDEVMTYICAELDIPVYMIAGNHDGAERIAQCSELLKKSGLYIAGAITDRPQVINVNDVDIYLLPWISTDKVRSVYPDKADSISSMEDAYRVVLDSYRATFVHGHKNILVSHAFLVNADTSVSDRAAEVGRATMVGSYVFDGFDYVALGHLHGPQQINKHIRYSGSPMAYSFGKEEKQEKSVTIIDTDTREQLIVPIPQLHKRTTLSDTFDNLMKADYEESILNGYVRLEVTDSYVGMDSIAAFREKYSNLLEISGKGFERDDARITMTIEEFENADSDPEAVFTRYCQDILEQAPGEHLLNVFKEAVKEYQKEVIEE
ncbi:MAG: exonuclease SbcCD subunit D [Lachnospiraceae bacterium]|nr:exonuclease SbcCD subunit D [Lachnospiraceae bacterium]